MLTEQINGFIEYCKVSGFEERSIQALSIPLKDFNKFLKAKRISRIRSVTYSHLSAFVADFLTPYMYVKKSRIWSLRQFFHYLKLNGIVRENIASYLPYSKTKNTVLHFLTIRIICLSPN